MNRDIRVFSADGDDMKVGIISDEDLLTFYLNNLKFISLFALPKNLKELIVGFLISEGVCSFDDIKEIRMDGTNVFVEIEGKDRIELLTELRSSGCSGIMTAEPKPIENDVIFSKKIILDSLKHFADCSLEWSKTGGTHAAFLISKDGKLLTKFEDVGRHNALDKVVGWSFINSADLSENFLLFTGRLSSGIVTKAARSGIPMVVSNTAPLSKAVSLGDRLGLTLVGFARDSRFNVYTCDYRIGSN